uniref:Zinc finger CCCH domain-containing protein 3 n=1 Tax=Strigamia maritima TaxID=126957 RepID=T1J249_STRMM
MKPLTPKSLMQMKILHKLGDPRQTTTSSVKTSRIVNLPQQRRTVQTQRVVMKPEIKDLSINRLTLKSSTPKMNRREFSSPKLSPVVNAKKPGESVNNFSIKVVSSKQADKNDRIVLKSSRYKWSSKCKATNLQSSNLKLNNSLKQQKNSSKSPFKKPSIILKTPTKLLRAHSTNQIMNRYKLIRNQSSVSKKNSLNFVRKVGKYSIKYVVKDKKIVRRDLKNRSAVYTKFHLAKRGNSFQSFSKNNSWKQQKVEVCKKGKIDQFVFIGGLLYKSSPNKLSRTNDVAPKKTSTEQSKLCFTELSTKMITVRGIKFMLDPFGKTLKRVNQQSATGHNLNCQPNMSRIDIGGETFLQTKPGLLVLSQANKKRTLANRSINRSIHRLVAAKKKSKQYCLFYSRFGKCSKKDLGTCPYQHDPDKVAVCTRFLQGKCTVENCPFSHKICSKKMPVCRFFLRGRCNADTCPYSHVNVNPEADNCENFLKGFCSLGEKCKKLHVFFCAEFQRTGKCTKTKCPLKHEPREKRKSCATIGSSVAKKIEFAPSVSDDKKKPAREKTAELPSFIKLDDTIDSIESESTVSSKDILEI